jgi:hypothetical protein
MVCLSVAVLACQGSVQTTAHLVPTPNATQQARILTDTAEAKYLSLMSLDLGELVRAQSWFKELTQSHLDLIAAILRCERAAKAKGEEYSVQEMLTYAAEQPWYNDGLDAGEARGLRGAFEAYTESLSDKFAPPIGPVLATSLRFGLFQAVGLPESGEIILVVSADDPSVGQDVLQMAVEELPRIEELVGAYPYKFLHMMVTDLGDFYAGLSYDEFIVIDPRSVDRPTIIHELTHSTMYGKFPIWFEEGFAHFVEYYLTESLEQAAKEFAADLAHLGSDTRLYVGAYRDSSLAGYLAERAQGFLFMKAVHDLNGIESLMGTVRSLRTKSLGDQDLLRAFVQYGTRDQQDRLKTHYCDQVIGVARNYC